MISPKDISTLSEDGFRRQILLPLLSAMGYAHVDHSHGPDELGKDIVAWRRTPQGTRENVAVVAKRGRIRASASRGLYEVCTQIKQAYHSKYIDKVSGDEICVHKVVLAASGAIRQQAVRAIQSELGPNIERHLEFWDGPKILELLAEYLPLTIPERLNALGKALGELKHVVVEPSITTHGTIFRVGTRENGTELANVVLTFPRTPEGDAVHKGFLRFIEEGRRVKIPGTFISKFAQHPELRELFGPAKPSSMELASMPPKVEIPVQLSAISREGELVEYPGLRMWLESIGRERAVFSSRPRQDALSLELVTDRRGGGVLHLRFNCTDHSAYRALIAVRFWCAMAHAARFEITELNGNRALCVIDEPRVFDPPPSDLSDLLENLYFLQCRLGREFVFSEDINLHDVENASLARRALETGHSVEPFDGASAILDTGQARFILRTFSPGTPLRLALTSDEARVTISGHDIMLGRLVRVVSNVTMTVEGYNRLKRSVRSGLSSHPWQISSMPACEGIHYYFVDYLTGEAKEEYDRVYGSVPKHTLELPESSR